MFSAPHFSNDEAARTTLEDIRWRDGRVCPHCGSVDKSYTTKRTQKCGATVYRCGEPQCRKDFSVTTKTVMESSHIALHKWMQGFYLMASSKKGVSAHQLHRTLGITYKAAWFMAHRIREAMRAGDLAPPMGGEGKIVEADETYYGQKDDIKAGLPPSMPDDVRQMLLRGHPELNPPTTPLKWMPIRPTEDQQKPPRPRPSRR